MSDDESELGLAAAPARIAARVRAAIAYSEARFVDVGERSGLGVTKLRRIASATNPRGATLLELWSIADALGVPRAWLEIGQWTDDEPQAPRPAMVSGRSVEDRLEIIERYLFALLRLEETRAVPLPPAPENPAPPSSGAPRARANRANDPRALHSAPGSD